jgi:hypothetical protein
MGRLAFLLWLLLSGMAAAQVVTVRSGQHDGFTRLVLTFPEPGGWDFGRTGDGYGFRARVGGWRFDIAGVFDRVPRDRLSALWADPETGVLRLGLGCACHAIATPFRPGIVVIDILDGAAPPDSPYETALADAGRSLPPLVPQRMVRPKSRPPTIEAQVAPLAPQPAPTPAMPLPGLRSAPSDMPVVLLPQPDPRSDILRQTLLRDLSRGIASGAVDPVQRLPEGPEAPGPAPVSTATPPAAPPATPQLRVRPGGQDAQADMATDGRICIADDRLDLAAWGAEGAVADQIVQAQAGLLGEFDRPDRDRLLQLVRLYLYMGFGAEAGMLMRVWAPDDTEAEVLTALAALVDGGTGTAAFQGMQGCPTAAALWSVLAQDPADKATDIDTAAVLRAFSALPIGLRRHLGPALSDRMMALGDTAMVQAIRDAIDRAPGPHGDGLTMIDAGLDMANGRSDSAEQKLASVVADGGSAEARALAALVDSLVRRGETPDPAQLLALDAQLRERQGLDEERDLRAAFARGLTVTGAAERAFTAIATDTPGQFAELWQLLAERGGAMELAALALSPPGPPREELPAAARLAVAGRLLDIGFPEAAVSWAEGLDADPAMMLRARAALAARDGRAVLRQLAGQSSAEAEILRAEALELLGDLEAAATARLAAGQPEEAARLRFLQRQWDQVAVGDDAALAGLLSARTRDSAAPPEPAAADVSLATARAEIGSSAEVRDLVAAVLAARIVPEP